MHISVFQPPFFANEAYIPEQLIVRVLISLRTNETFATFLVSAIVDDDYSYSCMYRYFSRRSMKMRHTTSGVLSWYINFATNERMNHSPFLDAFVAIFATLGCFEEAYSDFATL